MGLRARQSGGHRHVLQVALGTPWLHWLGSGEGTNVSLRASSTNETA
jgi:hypothetical protein